jgi:predicted metalloprotease
MGRRRDYEEGYEDARREMEERDIGSSRRGGGDFTATVLIKYLATVIVVIIVAYMVLQILGGIQGAFYRVP